jgi:thymidine kinase
MFSGKTRELILRVERAKRANKGVQVFIPDQDHRNDGEVISHAQQSLEAVGVSATPIEDAYDMASFVRRNVTVVAIDEAQFFQEDLRKEVIKMICSGRQVIVAGLDMDYQGEPFERMPELLAVAHEVIKMQAVCVQCGNDAQYTFRKDASKERVHIGASESYEARCTGCYYGL